jgi:tripartite-type tricarboxylate transporter receptor subunit TctC
MNMKGNMVKNPANLKHALVAALALACAAGAAAQTLPKAGGYPDKAIRFVSPFPPGGGNDTATRIVTQKLAELTGQSVIVENRGGAGGNLGAELAAKSPADGYTAFTGQVSIMAVNPALYARTGFDSLRDFVPLTQINAAPLVIVVAAASPFKTFQELAAETKAKPGSVTFATPGNGTLSHLLGEVLKQEAGMDMVHVPYKGAGTAITDLLGGQVGAMITSTSSVAGFVQNGKMRALAVTSPRRLGVFKDVPMLAELGYRNMVFDDWYGFFLPAGTPKERVDYLAQALVRALNAPEVVSRIRDGGSEVVANTPAQFAEVLRADIARWSQAVKLTGLRLD